MEITDVGGKATFTHILFLSSTQLRRSIILFIYLLTLFSLR
jgi:hypothetical protein